MFAPGTEIVWMAFGKPTDYSLDARDISGELPGHMYVEGDPVLPRPDGGPPKGRTAW